MDWRRRRRHIQRRAGADRAAGDALPVTPRYPRVSGYSIYETLALLHYGNSPISSGRAPLLALELFPVLDPFSMQHRQLPALCATITQVKP